MSQPTPEVCDLLIIGAGMYGIQAARHYLEVHPTEKVILLESGTSVGGVWSKDRCYDSFWTQTPVHMAGFSDDVITTVSKDDDYHGFFPGKVAAQFLENYVHSHEYGGQTIYSRIKFEEQLLKLEKINGKWVANTKTSTYVAPKVADASGLTSEPLLPNIPGIDSFQGTVLHHKQFGQSSVLKRADITTVAVIGGSKSALDVAYASAKAGKKVFWLIRKTGAGPAALFNVQGQPPYRNANESFYTRFLGFLVASDFARYPWWVSWLYSTRYGTRLLQKFWDFVTLVTFGATDYDRKDGHANGFYNLKPDTPIFWQNDSSGVNNRADLLDTIAHHVQVLREDIVNIDERSLNLANGNKIGPIDALVYATGWKNTHSYLDPATKAELGLPEDANYIAENKVSIAATSPSTWEALEQAEATRVLKKFAILSEPPKHHKTKSVDTPYRLYRCMVPLTDSSIVFLGHIMVGHHFRTAEAQALWAIAMWDGQVPSPAASSITSENTVPQQKALASVARTVAWGRLRYLDKGQAGNWFYYDVLPYSDLLYDEVGVTCHRRAPARPAFAGDVLGAIAQYKAIKTGQSLKSVKLQDTNVGDGALVYRGSLAETWAGAWAVWGWAKPLM